MRRFLRAARRLPMGLVLPALVAAGLGAAALGGVLSQHGDGRGGPSPPSSKAGSCAARTARATVSLPLSATRRASARATGPDVRVTRTATVPAADGGAVRASATVTAHVSAARAATVTLHGAVVEGVAVPARACVRAATPEQAQRVSAARAAATVQAAAAASAQARARARQAAGGADTGA